MLLALSWTVNVMGEEAMVVVDPEKYLFITESGNCSFDYNWSDLSSVEKILDSSNITNAI